MTAPNCGTLESAYRAAREALPALRDQAAETDASATFPNAAISVLRNNGLMGLLVPAEYGGAGGDLGDLVGLAGLLGSACTSTAMIWAMHCQQADCVVRFGSERLRAELLPRIASGDVYLASVTTEPGKGGHLLSGQAAIENDLDCLRFERDAPIVTGGSHADGFLVTMRASADSAGNQVTLCYADRDQVKLEETSSWDTLGMRGTASLGFRLRGAVPSHQIIGEPGDFRTVAIESMIPAGHLAWSALWLGSARSALRGVLNLVRSRGSDRMSDLTAVRLARARIDIELTAAYLGTVRDEVLAHRRDERPLTDTPTQIHVNNLKVIASELTYRAVDTLLEVAGLFAGYKRDAPIPLERIFRDLRSASLNYANDRLLTMNGTLTLLDRDVTLATSGLL
jgi:acyl-CoA dehydrogenase